MLDRNPLAGPQVSGTDTDPVVAPGPVWTPLIPATLEPEHVRKFGRDSLWKRPAQPVEIAAGFVYLASADARHVSGETLATTGLTSSR